ncbi:hypothetical protein DB30_03187 [Enhygromyxa salina]|uniref:Uncharacterized protein n=1 Tax=Enhygromyxa salina TaxID=215803 RepID=A0A0C2D2I2_9BACT|nr:hypothetical protein [Enhygromyxa salina]KIG17486.1 hypothetical protein DB30_03187 [Enhygromyxa salina]
MTLGCASRDNGFTLDDGDAGGSEDASGDGSGDGDGDGGPSGDTNTEPNDVPFELVSASLNATGQFVVLRFSEPVAPVNGVDPADFRISFAALSALCSGRDGCVDQTSYWDPNFFAATYIGYQPYSNARFEVDLITAGNQATDVFLRFETPLDPALCEYFAPYEGEYGALFVHHAPGNIPLKSSDGESLAAIGPQWVAQAQPFWDTDGEYPNLNPKISIPCPP